MNLPPASPPYSVCWGTAPRSIIFQALQPQSSLPGTLFLSYLSSVLFGTPSLALIDTCFSWKYLHGIYGSLSSFSEGELVKAIPFVLLADGGGFFDERTAGSCFSGHDAFGLFRLPSPFLEIVFRQHVVGIVLPADRRRLLSDLSSVQQPENLFFFFFFFFFTKSKRTVVNSVSGIR